MSRRRVLLIFAGLTAGAVGSQLVRADPVQRVARLGFVLPGSPSTAPQIVNAFWDRLRELGYVEGQNLIVERRWAEGRMERLPALMAEVIERNIDVIFTASTPAAIAAKRATSTIPIVAAAMGDPVRSGVVASLAHPRLEPRRGAVDSEVLPLVRAARRAGETLTPRLLSVWLESLE